MFTEGKRKANEVFFCGEEQVHFSRDGVALHSYIRDRDRVWIFSFEDGASDVLAREVLAMVPSDARENIVDAGFSEGDGTLWHLERLPL